MSPKIIEALDNSIRDQLQRTGHEFFAGVLISAFVVAIGVVLEGPEILNELWPSLFGWVTRTSKERLHSFKRVIQKIAFLGWLLIGLGVFGEGVFEGFQNRAEGQLQTFNNILLQDARLTASAAEESAQGAADASSRARDEADAANKAAGEAQTKANAAIAEANIVLHAVSDRFVLNPAAFRDDLRKRFGPSPAAVKASSGTATGTFVRLTSYSGDPEGFRLCQKLWGFMEWAQMGTIQVCGSTTLLPALAPEVGILVSGSNKADVKDLAGLLASDSDAGLPAVSTGFSNSGLTILVGRQQGIIAEPATLKHKTKTQP